MSAPECRKPQPCLSALADGWINATDLCPACTQAFMDALDGISGPLTWHQAYRDRATT